MTSTALGVSTIRPQGQHDHSCAQQRGDHCCDSDVCPRGEHLRVVGLADNDRSRRTDVRDLFWRWLPHLHRGRWDCTDLWTRHLVAYGTTRSTAGRASLRRHRLVSHRRREELPRSGGPLCASGRHPTALRQSSTPSHDPRRTVSVERSALNGYEQLLPRSLPRAVRQNANQSSATDFCICVAETLRYDDNSKSGK